MGVLIFFEYRKKILTELIEPDGDDSDAIFLHLLSELHRILFLSLASKFFKKILSNSPIVTSSICNFYKKKSNTYQNFNSIEKQGKEKIICASYHCAISEECSHIIRCIDDNGLSDIVAPSAHSAIVKYGLRGGKTPTNFQNLNLGISPAHFILLTYRYQIPYQ